MTNFTELVPAPADLAAPFTDRLRLAVAAYLAASPGAVGDPAAVQRVCDGLTDQKIYRFAGKWLARLPQPFTRDDEDAD